jgi:hypothetical protein
MAAYTMNADGNGVMDPTNGVTMASYDPDLWRTGPYGDWFRIQNVQEHYGRVYWITCRDDGLMYWDREVIKDNIYLYYEHGIYNEEHMRLINQLIELLERGLAFNPVFKLDLDWDVTVGNDLRPLCIEEWFNQFNMGAGTPAHLMEFDDGSTITTISDIDSIFGEIDTTAVQELMEEWNVEPEIIDLTLESDGDTIIDLTLEDVMF